MAYLRIVCSQCGNGAHYDAFPERCAACNELMPISNVVRALFYAELDWLDHHDREFRRALTKLQS